MTDRRNEKWVIISHPGDYVEMGKKYGISPVTARIIRNRGHENEDEIKEFLDPKPSRLYDGSCSGFRLKDMDRAAAILKDKISQGKKIRIVGDYDIDGISSVYILLKGISKAGGSADYRIPHRIRDGYGINNSIINEASEAGIDTLITCDNGISAAEEVSNAKSLGMTVIVTDHHEIPFHMEGDKRVENLPEADAVVDPHRSDCGYPYKSICGAYVAFKLIECLYEEMGISREETGELLEIAAFATIGDVMPLTGENRILVKEGLKRLEKTKNPGMRCLIALNKLEGKRLLPYHVGFVLGPCLNAAGRLSDADDALALLLSGNEEEARPKAVVLKELNDSRKSLTEKGTEEALNIASSPEYEKDTVLVIFLSDCHESIAGIIAGRVKERLGKPVFILTDGLTSGGDHCLKGSGRSIEAWHMYEEMNKVSDLFIRFGGHAMAAGLSMDEENFEEFKEKVNENSVLTEDDLKIRVKIDMELPFSFLNIDLVRELSLLEPFGTGNEKPLFAARDVTIRDMRIFGSTGNVLKGRASDGRGTETDCVYFGSDAQEIMGYIGDLQRQGKRLKIIYSPGINEYRGEENLQIVIESIRG